MPSQRPAQTTLAFHASRIVTDAGVLVAMAAMSMAFVISPTGDRSAIDADALPALLLLLPIFVITLIPDHTRPVHPALGWVALVLGLAALPYSFVKMLDASALADTLGGSVGLGARLLVVGCLITVIGIAIGIARSWAGLPSGGTPGRSASYVTRKRSRQRSVERPSAAPATRQEHLPAIDTTAAPAPTTKAPETEPVGQETQDAPQVKAVRPAVEQPEIVFPDTGAVAREAESDPVDEDPTMNTAERADAALTEHMLAMFDDDDSLDPERSEP